MTSHIALLNTKHSNIIVATLLLFYTLLGMAVDIIAPSLPTISKELGVSHTVSQNLISVYLYGFVLGSCFIGIVTDSIGRQKVIFAALSLFTLVSLLPLFHLHASSLLTIRIIQGMCLGAFSVLARCILSDILNEQQFITTAILLSTFWGIGPIFGPVIGANIQYYFSWQTCFLFLALFAFGCLLVLVLFLPETQINKRPLYFKSKLCDFKTVVSYRPFLRASLTMACLYSILISFNTVGPFLIQNTYAQSSLFFSKVAFSVGLSYVLGTITCRLMLKNKNLYQVMTLTIPRLLAVAVLINFLSFYFNYSLYYLFIVLNLLFFLVGCSYPAVMSFAMNCFRDIAGACSSSMTFINVSLTATMGLIASLLPIYSNSRLLLLFLFLLLTATILYPKEKKIK